jgi:hypothetical protein
LGWEQSCGRPKGHYLRTVEWQTRTGQMRSEIEIASFKKTISRLMTAEVLIEAITKGEKLSEFLPDKPLRYHLVNLATEFQVQVPPHLDHQQ